MPSICRTMCLTAAVLVTAALPVATQAQKSAASDSAPESQWATGPEIVVTAEPAMWKLTKGDSVVWVMGTLSLWPADFQWKQVRFLRVLKGSRQLLVPASKYQRMRSDPSLPGQTLKDVLTPETYQRFTTAVEAEGLSTEAYSGLRPAWAGYRFTSDFLTRHKISTTYYPPAVRQLAADNHVPIVEVADTGLKSLDEHFSRMDPADAEACLNDYLDNIRYYQFDMPSVADAWAHSDLKTVLQYYRDPSYITCLLKTRSATASYDEQAVDRMTRAIREALNKPGKVVAVVIVTDLLRKHGVLDRLKAEGVEITVPAQIE